MNGADLASVVPIAEITGENEEEERGLSRMFDEAHAFLSTSRLELASMIGCGLALVICLRHIW